MNKFITAPKATNIALRKSKYEKFFLKDNPFPSTPFISKNNTDIRMNGDIYENSIREDENKKILDNFIKVSQNNQTHLRLGYLVDVSYIGRGNGKSAFLLNLSRQINKEFSLDLSEQMNKCFSIHFFPEPGGRTKTFSKFTDKIFEAIFSQNILNTCIAIIYLKAVMKLKPDISLNEFTSDSVLIEKLLSENWYFENDIEFRDVYFTARDNEFLQKLPFYFNLFRSSGIPNSYSPINQKDVNYYYNDLKANEKLEFIYTHLVNFFLAADFNGAYIFVDDFERILEFQSARQMRDFAVEMRNALFDGLYLNSNIGFYNFLLVIHAGVHRLIAQAWSDSGMDKRAPITQEFSSNHIIEFKKLTLDKASSLIKRYLKEFRTEDIYDDLFPFDSKSIERICEISELNASNILRHANNLLDKAANDDNCNRIDVDYVSTKIKTTDIESDPKSDILELDSTNLHDELMRKN